MKVVLVKDAPKVGKKYDIVNVSAGYAQNYLFPNHFARLATEGFVAEVEAKKKTMEADIKIQEDLLAKNMGDIAKVTVEIKGKVNEKGHLFAGIHKETIAEEVKKQTRLDISPRFIKLEHPVKEVGEHMIEVEANGKTTKLKLIVTASDSE
ncbi:MAG: 50S ribosomal protein L9 [Patescibacteria group bacterium]|nr:50S ribosomal protein L9 [bacterium]MDZ4241153.1 50S ribosomal protein L9 [Patescibacteria group bacterium]